MAWHSVCQQIRCSLRADEGNWHQPLQEMVTTMHHLGPISACAHDPLSAIRAMHTGWGQHSGAMVHTVPRAVPTPCSSCAFAVTTVLRSLFTPLGAQTSALTHHFPPCSSH